MKKWLKWVLGVSCGLILVIAGSFVILNVIMILLFIVPTNDIDNRNPARQADMIRVTLEWGRLAPFPKNVQDFSIRTEGNMFTRSFRASFTAPDEEIREWVAASPGLTEAGAKVTDDGKREYIISPGGGANYAEVTIDFESGKVKVYVAWS